MLDVEQHPQPLYPLDAVAPLPQLWQTKMSPGIAKCPLGSKIVPG